MPFPVPIPELIKVCWQFGVMAEGGDCLHRLSRLAASGPDGEYLRFTAFSGGGGIASIGFPDWQPPA